MQKIYKKLWIILPAFLIAFSSINQSYATHIRAGEITAVRTGPLTYIFTITLYTDDCVVCAESPSVVLDFGDGTVSTEIPWNPGFPINISPETQLNIYQVEHTFPSPGQFRVFMVEENRNADVVNVNNRNSVTIPFSVSTTILIDPSLGLNSTPVLTVDPIDLACVGQRFTHNPGAFDADDDSLSFRILVPQQSGFDDVPNYQEPNDTTFGIGTEEDSLAIPDFTIDPVSGDLVWDAPALQGEYNIAFAIDEWRNGVLIGTVVRDMQVIVQDCNNRRPDLEDGVICVVANEDPNDDSNIINQVIRATDPDGDRIIIETSRDFESVYDTAFFDVAATFSFDSSSSQFGSAEALFRWDTRCEHVRQQPYIVVFRAQDRPINPLINGPLVDVESWLVTVKGPSPIGLVTSPDGNAINLSWNDYRLRCPGFTEEQYSAMEIIVWRREGCVTDIPCESNPAQLGYQEIGRTSVSDTTFRDVGPLSVGLPYSYVITVNFPEPLAGVSQASIPQCIVLPIETPVITNVDILETSPTGAVDVQWIFPPELPADSTAYFYNIYRAEGQEGTNFVRINSTPIPDPANGTANVPDPNVKITFTDNVANSITAPNTQGVSLRYQIELLAGAGQDSLNSSVPASSVRLNATPAENSVILDWTFNVPWSNQSNLERGVLGHFIYRRAEDEPGFTLIDTVFVGVTQYIDAGGFNGECLDPALNYFYRVEAVGSYYNDILDPRIIPLDTALNNNSQVDSAMPLDEIPPDSLSLFIESANCSFVEDKLCSETLSFPTEFFNLLTWESGDGGDQCGGAAAFQIFYRTSREVDYDFNNPIATVTDTFFFHRDLPFTDIGVPSQAGCYVVVAVDQSGNTSVPSNEVCQDNCLYYVLPNTITPNGDNVNDLFQPCPAPLYAETVDFEVYNRWGNLVYATGVTTDVNLNWDGTSDEGNELESGVYFYKAKVQFNTISPELQEQEFNGWIKILRDTQNNPR